MSASDSPAVLVARFLKSNNYTETLDVFLTEAGLPADAGSLNRDDLTLEKVLQEKKTFDISLRFEKLGTDDEKRKGWSHKSPARSKSVSTLPSRSNLLFVSTESLLHDESCPPSTNKCLISTSADRRFNSLNLPSLSGNDSLSFIHESPILSCSRLGRHHLLVTSMSGQLNLIDHNGNIKDKRRDHLKYVVQVQVYHDPSGQVAWIATAGWDAKCHLYSVHLSSEQVTLPAPAVTIDLPTNPESMVFITHPETSTPVLILTRRDSTFLYYYTVDTSARLIGKQNLAPLSNAWIAFTPSSIALCPTDSTLLAVATSSVPHMKLIIVRLMLPPMTEDVTAATTSTTARSSLLDDDTAPNAPTAASVAREVYALQDREAAAILVHISTMAPQTPYSTPALAWRPDGTGVWVNSDDGVIRGVEASTGKIVATLHGHDPGSKIRCLCTCVVENEDGQEEEWLISGGFDQKLIVWRPE